MGNYTISNTTQSFQSGELELRYKGLERDTASAFNTTTTNGTNLTGAELGLVANIVKLMGGKISYSIPANAANNIRIEISTRPTTFYIDVHDDIFFHSLQILYLINKTYKVIKLLRSQNKELGPISVTLWITERFTGGRSNNPTDIKHRPTTLLTTPLQLKLGRLYADVVIDHSITKLTLSITPNGGSGSQSLVFRRRCHGH